MKELKFEELSTQQKLGMVMCGLIPGENRTDENDEYVLELIRNHSLGAVWVNPKTRELEKIMARIKETADYPILIVTDAESGMGEYTIGKHNTLGMADSEELAYAFGKITAIGARKMGYNVVCNPILDTLQRSGVSGSNTRVIGSDKYRVTELSKEEARGMHDGGVLTVGKHYPSPTNKPGRVVDSHMAESFAIETKEELIENNLYPYIELYKEGLLDGIMTSHSKLVNIDEQYPTSLSKKVIDVIREQGFDGFAITDALSMMGVVAKFGLTDPKGMCIEAGNDLALAWTSKSWLGYEAICDCYKRGIISDERLDEATKRVLAAQHKVLALENPKFTEITEEDKELFERLNRDSVYARTDEGLSAGISKDGKHYFMVLVANETDIADSGKVEVDTFSGGIFYGGWYNPKAIMDRIARDFPNSECVALREYPTTYEIQKVLENAANYEDVVLITYMDAAAYKGKDCFTSRVISIVDALQVTEKVSAVMHFGNPYVLQDLVHIPRIILGCCSLKGVAAAFEVLEGNYPAKGKLTFDVKFE